MNMDDVISEIAVKAPDLLNHLKVDRAWLWYCGPALMGKANEPVRQALKGMGFRFAPKGRMVDGAVGHWAHSCSVPMPRYRKGKVGNCGPSVVVGEVVEDSLFSAIALMETL